jgi:hypothetical protein
MIYTNPVLNIAGYHIFEIQGADGKTTALICKRAYVRLNFADIPIRPYELFVAQ